MNINPKDFFDQRALNEREKIQSADELWDFLVTPDRHSQFNLPNGSMFYRGQPDSLFGLDSKLYRLIASQLKDTLSPLQFKRDAEKYMREVEDLALKTARENGLGMGFSDLQLMGLLQHHGMPTRLIDVTRSPLIALYFAVEKQDESEGRLFIITTKNSLKDTKTTFSTFPRRIQAPLPWNSSARATSNWQQKVFEAEIGALDARMVAQEASFLVGEIYTSGGKFPQYLYEANGKTTNIDVSSMRAISTLLICFPKNNAVPKNPNKWSSFGWSLTIPAEWKSQLRNRLLLHDPSIFVDSIYPPIGELKRLISHVVVSAIAAK